MLVLLEREAHDLVDMYFPNEQPLPLCGAGLSLSCLPSEMEGVLPPPPSRLQHSCVYGHCACVENSVIEPYSVSQRPDILLFFTLRSHYDRHQSRMHHLFNVIYTFQHLVMRVRRRLYSQTPGSEMSVDDFVRPERLVIIEDALHSVEKKITELDSDYFPFFATSQHLRDGLDTQTSFARVLISVTRQEVEDIRDTFFSSAI